MEYALLHPHELEVVAVAEPNQRRRNSLKLGMALKIRPASRIGMISLQGPSLQTRY